MNDWESLQITPLENVRLFQRFRTNDTLLLKACYIYIYIYISSNGSRNRGDTQCRRNYQPQFLHHEALSGMPICMVKQRVDTVKAARSRKLHVKTEHLICLGRWVNTFTSTRGTLGLYVQRGTLIAH